jgi:hypothetical protein
MVAWEATMGMTMDGMVPFERELYGNDNGWGGAI